MHAEAARSRTKSSYKHLPVYSIDLFCSPSPGTYHLSTPESAGIGSPVGRIKAYDADVGENAEMWYSILDGDGQDMFNIITDSTSQEGVITVKKVNRPYIQCLKYHTVSRRLEIKSAPSATLSLILILSFFRMHTHTHTKPSA